MFSSFSNTLFGHQARPETNSSPISAQTTSKRGFFRSKRKCLDIDQKLDDVKLSASCENPEHRTPCDEKMSNETEINRIERLNDVEQTDKNENDKPTKNIKCKKERRKANAKQNDKLVNKSKEKSNKGLNKLSRWLYNKFEHHSDKEELSDSDLNSEHPSKANSKDDLNKNSDVNRDSSTINLDNQETHKCDLRHRSTDRSTEDEDEQNLIRTNPHRYTNQLFNIRKRLLRYRNDEQDENDKQNVDGTSSESSSTEECDCCKQKIKKLRMERLKLRKQLRRGSSWKMFMVFLNPLFLLAVFFYLLYSELTAVRAESINLTTTATIQNLDLFNKAEINLNTLNSSKLEQLIKTGEQANLGNFNGKPFDDSYGKLDGNSHTKGENENRSDNNERIDDDDKNEEANFYSSTLTEPLKIPISKRNFFSSFNSAKNRQQNQQFGDAQLLNLPAFKILAILPTTLSPQLSRHLHRSMELYYAYSEGLISSLELVQYFEHLRHPNGAQTDLSSALHHLQINTTISDHHHNDKLKFFLHTNHSELNYEDHLYAHLIQRIHHRNRTQHYSDSNSLYSATPDKPTIYNDQFLANNPRLNDKQYIEHFIQTNRKRLRPTIHQQSTQYSSQSTQFAEYTQQPEMQLSLVPLGNSSQRLINSLCDSIEIQRPTMILSLVEPTRNYYLEMLARISDIPMLTLTSEYQETASLQKLLIEVIFAFCSLSKKIALLSCLCRCFKIILFEKSDEFLIFKFSVFNEHCSSGSRNEVE